MSPRARKEHEALPATTCTGDDCTDKGPKHREHPRFPCACGMWYASERGRRAHRSQALARAMAEAHGDPAAIERLGKAWGIEVVHGGMYS
jgi:hypothetical protein